MGGFVWLLEDYNLVRKRQRSNWEKEVARKRFPDRRQVFDTELGAYIAMAERAANELQNLERDVKLAHKRLGEVLDKVRVIRESQGDSVASNDGKTPA